MEYHSIHTLNFNGTKQNKKKLRIIDIHLWQYTIDPKLDFFWP